MSVTNIVTETGLDDPFMTLLLRHILGLSQVTILSLFPQRWILSTNPLDLCQHNILHMVNRILISLKAFMLG